MMIIIIITIIFHDCIVMIIRTVLKQSDEMYWKFNPFGHVFFGSYSWFCQAFSLEFVWGV